MTIYFAPSSHGFYQDSINSNIPADAIVITHDTYIQLALTPLPTGFTIGLDAAGYPTLLPVVPDLEVMHTVKTDQISRACEGAITSGFWSSALGARYLYSSSLDDQLNLTTTILAGVDSIYPCRDHTGAKEFRAHSIQQLRQVGDDFAAFRIDLLQKANRLKQQLDQALATGDLEALQSVTWESES